MLHWHQDQCDKCQYFKSWLSKNSSLILIDFSLSVKAAALIFISGRGSAITSAKEGKLGLFIIWQI